MSISYEEALGTLESMFGDPWTQDTLDAVLRHQKGHMENTVDLILRHGDKSPAQLVNQLESGVDPNQSAIDADAHLARMLAQATNTRRATNTTHGAVNASASTPSGTGRPTRGTPTDLPSDFLRIPNSTTGATNIGAGAASTSAVAGGGSLADDEALARMLQDELFSEELARNPDFAHLATGRPRTSGGLPSGRRQPQPRNVTSAQQQGIPGINPAAMLGKIGELGDNARRRLQMMAAQFNAKNGFNNNNNSGGSGGVNSHSRGGVSQAETRGLLDGDDEEDTFMELTTRKDQ